MGRPKKQRCSCVEPGATVFKPSGAKVKDLDWLQLKADEVEALKLHELDKLSHERAAEHMGISQPTFSRILSKAHKKLATMIISGSALKVESTNKEAV